MEFLNCVNIWKYVKELYTYLNIEQYQYQLNANGHLLLWKYLNVEHDQEGYS